MNRFQRDELYDQAQDVVDFRFDERVSAVFPDMIHRSVPGYATLLQLLGIVGASFVPEKGLAYDLGCSLGGASIALSQHLPDKATIHAIDLSPSMASRFRAYVEGNELNHITVSEGDVTKVALEPCELVILNLTLQFVAPDARDAVLARIYSALRPGGALLISEKTRPEADTMRCWHESFKRAQGYSDLAIAQKRESLEHIMQTDAADEVEARLQRAGFSHVARYMQALQFIAWVAVK
ncbi:carboxy-S-adenosyl-L-methionine synthase CmoA [Suttonella sp. R2A3]|uniref:carboxy-S-adenosyl-L-methionine synthase CmoA n=1 Tax=Suttonella sp. R2A3 TaxID=2908648 RepID=UPI001F1A380D|nr:carboxy-S-adenosyl-L-methionine synthase CmoA [Suttonella sp. R2A3]UJF25235.1 carboxy-S-adenosyl-L-methionine synthase CmoA [Suttonella sp. R2A3]